jgi:hypothetical protein
MTPRFRYDAYERGVGLLEAGGAKQAERLRQQRRPDSLSLITGINGKDVDEADRCAGPTAHEHEAGDLPAEHGDRAQLRIEIMGAEVPLPERQ